jgi:hypothetical protein
MTKRTLLALLLLLPALSPGCAKPDTPNSNGANTANVGRQGSNANTADSLNTLVRTKEDKSVAVVVYHDGAGAPKILLVPDPIKLSKGKGQKLRFHVFNDTDVAFSRVQFTFAEDPFDGGFDITDITAGDDRGAPTRRIKPAAALKKYKYAIKVYGPDPTQPPIVELDPEVEIAT